MGRDTLFSLSVRSAEDVLSATAQATAIAQGSGLGTSESARLTLAALAAASRARESSGMVQIFRNNGGELEISIRTAEGAEEPVFSAPDASPAAELEELTALRQKHAGALSSVRALEIELEETNRGVLALYAELDDRAEKLRNADELKSRFLSYASHELRTPLNGIVGLTRMLMTGKARDDEEIRQIDFIRKAAEEMREMVNDLLDLAKVEAGKVTVTPSEFGLDFVFGALRGIFRPLLQTEDVVLAFDDTSAVPSVYSDEAKVSQILRNFLSNAIKFTEHGEVRVWAVPEGDRVRISVRDTGLGIAPEHLDHIFEEFSQIDSRLQRKLRGTGLGLPLCRKLAELLGGHVEVQSRVGEGSTFALVLPQKYHAFSAAPEQGVPPLQRRVPRVLIVDDVELDRYLLIHLLKRSGDYEIVQAEDGQAALEAAHREHPDLIFLDLNLPRSSGFGILAALREEESTARIPVAIVTAQTLSAEEHARLLESAIAVLFKEDLANAAALDIRVGEDARVEVRSASVEGAVKT